MGEKQQTESTWKTRVSYTEIEQDLLKAQGYASDLKFKYVLSIIGCLVVLFGIIYLFTYYIREKNRLLRRLQEYESLINTDKQTIEGLSIIKNDLQRDILACENNRKEQMQKNEQLENLSRLKEQLERELITLKAENVTLRNWKKEKENILEHFKNNRLYGRFHSPAGWEPTEEEWNILFSFIDESYPTFAIALQKEIYLSESEKKICYLSKIKVKPNAIATLLHLENASIYRKRLYEKLTGCCGTAKDLDVYLFNL